MIRRYTGAIGTPSGCLIPLGSTGYLGHMKQMYSLPRGAWVLATLALFQPTEALGQTPGSRTSADESDKVRPGDLIELVVWREEDLSGEFLVDRNGSVVLPLVGEYNVLDETPESLEEKVVAAFRRSIVNPSIDVIVRRRVRIMGAVTEPGLYSVDPTMTVADALALAGGRTTLGQRDRVVLYRNGEPIGSDVDVNTPVYESPIRSGDELLVPERSWLSRNAGVAIAGASTVAAILIALIR